MPLDREDCDSYWLTVTATDSGEPQLSSKVEVFVKVADVNDNAPRTDEMFYRVEVRWGYKILLDDELNELK